MLLIPGIAWASHSFTDVPDSDWAHADIAWLKDTGLTNGCGDGTTFCPEDTVKRKELAAFMHRLSGGDDRTIDGRLDALEAENAALKDLLSGVTRNGDILLFDGMNIQLINGAGTTDTTNSLGNLIIGYNDDNESTRTGSHMLVIGDRHTYTSYAGIVSGHSNWTTGPYSSVTGGFNNVASGSASSVTGGTSNHATGTGSSVTGGQHNTASGYSSSITGGIQNSASRSSSTIVGGSSNQIINGDAGAILGGHDNTVAATDATVLGGNTNIALVDGASIGGGDDVLCGSTNSFCAEGYVTAAD